MQKIIAFLQKYSMPIAIFWTIGIFVGCSLPGKDLPKVNLFEHTDKIVHFVFFAVFAIFWYWAVPRMGKWQIILIAIAYGIGTEFYQQYCVAGRSFDMWDALADGIGASCVALRMFNKK